MKNIKSSKFLHVLMKMDQTRNFQILTFPKKHFLPFQKKNKN